MEYQELRDLFIRDKIQLNKTGNSIIKERNELALEYYFLLNFNRALLLSSFGSVFLMASKYRVNRYVYIGSAALCVGGYYMTNGLVKSQKEILLDAFEMKERLNKEEFDYKYNLYLYARQSLRNPEKKLF